MKMKSRIISIRRSIVLRYGDYRRGVYVRRMERMYSDMLGIDFIRAYGSGDDKGVIRSPYTRCIRVNGVLPIFEIMDAGSMSDGIIGIDDVDGYLDALHDIWMCERGYTKDEVLHYCGDGDNGVNN